MEKEVSKNVIGPLGTENLSVMKLVSSCAKQILSFHLTKYSALQLYIAKGQFTRWGTKIVGGKGKNLRAFGISLI